MTKADLKAVLAIENEAFGSDHWQAKEFLYELEENEFAKIYVLEKDQEVIGYVDFMVLYERLEINNIAIKSDKQRQGYGQMLLDKVFAEAEKEGVEVISLEVKVTNVKAYNMYLKNGFIPMRKRSHYYSDGTDAIEMARGI